MTKYPSTLRAQSQRTIHRNPPSEAAPGPPPDMPLAEDVAIAILGPVNACAAGCVLEGRFAYSGPTEGSHEHKWLRVCRLYHCSPPPLPSFLPQPEGLHGYHSPGACVLSGNAREGVPATLRWVRRVSLAAP